MPDRQAYRGTCWCSFARPSNTGKEVPSPAIQYTGKISYLNVSPTRASERFENTMETEHVASIYITRHTSVVVLVLRSRRAGRNKTPKQHQSSLEAREHGVNIIAPDQAWDVWTRALQTICTASIIHIYSCLLIVDKAPSADLRNVWIRINLVHTQVYTILRDYGALSRLSSIASVSHLVTRQQSSLGSILSCNTHAETGTNIPSR